jgi:hypothetical protein
MLDARSGDGGPAHQPERPWCDHHCVVENIPRRLVFRIPAISQVGVFFAFLSASMVALAGSKWLLLVYLVPIGLGIWLWRTRTVVDTERIAVRRVFYTQVVDWSALAGLRVRERKWARAVLVDGREILLPSVHARHLPALALFSGGRLADPTEPATSADSGASGTAAEPSNPEASDTAPPAAPAAFADETGATV